ncbi:MAG: flagellar biosynthetic protein FliR [Clostridiales bacterium GWB2_37_7]|nr:MAG: flagellar biosynthetic protein FliR [Clostridiales bacterium GWB2_37_7]
MNDILYILIDKFVIFFLILVRMSSLFIITPVFGTKNVPSYLKITFAFFCSVILITLMKDVNVEFTNIYAYAALVAKELAVGLVLGYTSYLVFSALYFAGQIIDTQIGFGLVNVLDPLQDTQVPLTGNFMYIITILFFMLINGHYILLTALFKSYNVIPINSFVFNDVLFYNILNIFFETFAIGFKISIPVLAAALLAEIALGILAKTVPQMNVFVIGMPLKVGVGLLTLLAMMPMFISTMDVTFDKMYSYIYLIIKSMAKG